MKSTANCFQYDYYQIFSAHVMGCKLHGLIVCWYYWSIIDGKELFMTKLICLHVFLFFLTAFSAVADDVVRYVASEKYPDPKQSYFIDMLTLALEESRERYGKYKVQPVSVEMAQGRTSVMLERNEYLDLTWRMTTKVQEKRLQAIYVPLLKGMMGYRIFIIRRGEQEKFSKTMSLEDLQDIPLGQGYNWPDSDILTYNDFMVVKGYDTHLLNMLEKQRFDYFPRAIHEPWIEVKDKSGFVVEKNIMFKYPAPIYFFVNKGNTRLHQRLVFGLNKALASGKFDQLFYHHKVTAGILDKVKNDNRIIFNLKNPLLSKKSQRLLSNKALWLSL